MLFGLSTKSASAIGGAVLLVGVIIGTAAVLADDGDFGTIQAPAWKSGYAWTYEITGEVDYNVDIPGEFSDDGSFSIPAFTVKKEILNVNDFEAGGEKLYVGAASLPIGYILEMGMFDMGDDGFGKLDMFPTADRQRDLAPVPAWPDYQDGQLQGLSFGEASFIPDDYIRFPLEHGKRWTDTVQFDEFVLPEGEMEEYVGITAVKMVAEAGKMETLALPIGATRAVRLDFSYQPVGLQKAIADMREDAEDYGINVERFTVQIGLHEIAHYSPEYQAVVRDQFVLSVVVDLAFTLPDGQRFAGLLEVGASTVAELTGADLNELPDRSLDEIMAKLEGRDPIKDASGKGLDPASLYQLSLTSSADVVNAAEPKAVTFEVSTDREDGLPDGDSLLYIIRDGTGAKVDSGVLGGDVLQYTFDEAGVYTVTVSAVNGNGAMISQASSQVAANWIKTTQAECEDYSTFLSSECGSAAVPMRAGLKNVVLEARVDHVLPTLGQDRIQLYDGQGALIATAYSQGSGVYRIELSADDLDLMKPAGALRYTPEVGATETLDYDVRAYYSAVPAMLGGTPESVGAMMAMHDFRVIDAIMAPVDRFVQDAAARQVGDDLFDLQAFWA